MFQPKPFNEGFLEKKDGHMVYFAQYGNKEGTTILSLHGGPGSSSKPKHAQGFDLEKYQVVVFDQRGCGKSTPAGKLENNTTQKLCEDAERVREKLSIKKWFIAGGSWGSSLSLAYAELFPESVKGIMVYAVFLADRESFDWSFSQPNGIAQLFSDVWDVRNESLAVYGATSETAATVLLQKLQEVLLEEQKQITADVLNWEGNLMTSTSDVSYMTPDDVEEKDISNVKIFLHYEANGCFLKEKQLLQNISQIQDIPMVIVHGRHDILCPFQGAWDLHKAHPNSKIVTLPQSNHAFSVDGIVAKKYIFDSFLKDFD